MKDFVSHRWIGVLGLTATLAMVCAALVHYGYSGTALAGAALALMAGVFLMTRSSGPMTMNDVLRGVEAEPSQPATAREVTK